MVSRSDESNLQFYLTCADVLCGIGIMCQEKGLLKTQPPRFLLQQIFLVASALCGKGRVSKKGVGTFIIIILIIIVERFHKALFSALEQTHSARL